MELLTLIDAIIHCMYVVPVPIDTLQYCPLANGCVGRKLERQAGSATA